MWKKSKQTSTRSSGKPGQGGYMTRSRTRKINEESLSIGQVGTGNGKNDRSSASHRPQSSAKVCKNFCLKANNKQNGLRVLKKKPEVSAKAVRNGGGLNGKAVPISSTSMPKLHGSRPIISSPARAGATEPSLETLVLQFKAVILDQERRLQNLEARFRGIQLHLTQVLPAELDTIIVHADSLADNLRDRFGQDYEYLRERINHISVLLNSETPSNLNITIS